RSSVFHAYVKWYMPIHTGGFAILILWLLVVQNMLVQLTLFLLILIPGLFYLIYYYKDARSHLVEQVTYFGTACFVIIALLAWPSVYGRSGFDPSLSPWANAPSTIQTACANGLEYQNALLLSPPKILPARAFCKICSSDGKVRLLEFKTWPDQDN